MVRPKADQKATNIYVVYEGEAYLLNNLSDYVLKYCSQENWMSDWLFTSAESPEIALNIAQIVDSERKAPMRVQRKTADIRDKRDRIFNLDSMTPVQIWESVENPEHRSSMSFNQGWFSLV